jgi:hypothetical protein
VAGGWVLAALVLLPVACGGGGSGEEAVESTVATTRLRSQNDAACEHLAEAHAIDRETARLSNVIAQTILRGDEAAVLEAAEAFAVHVESTALRPPARRADAVGRLGRRPRRSLRSPGFGRGARDTGE